ncbi:MAG: ATP-dependent Clp protease, protease subunit [Chloroflexota bacterium]|nr:ATP-dependent Clp protease, protease subunit [Chloroflexota bacterium]
MLGRPAGLDEALMRERILVVGRLDHDAATDLSARLVLLDRDDGVAPVHLHVNCDSGSADAALSLYDTTRFVTAPVHTLCAGAAGTAAIILVASGAPGHRTALPHARFILRRPTGDLDTAELDAEAALAEAARLREAVTTVIARHTGRDPEEVAGTLRKGAMLTARQAADWGLIDEVIDQPPKGWRGIVG